MKNEKDMAAFEAEMKKNCYATPIRGRVREYASGGDQALYDGWKMAMEENGNEREACALIAEAYPKYGESIAEEIRARGDK